MITQNNKMRICLIGALVSINMISCTQENKAQIENASFIIEIQYNLILNEQMRINEYLKEPNFIIYDGIKSLAEQNSRISPYFQAVEKISKETELLITFISEIQSNFYLEFKSLNIPYNELSDLQSRDIVNNVLYESETIDSLKQLLQNYSDLLTNHTEPTHEFIGQKINDILSITISTNGQNQIKWEEYYFNANLPITLVLGNLELYKTKIYMAENNIYRFFKSSVTGREF